MKVSALVTCLVQSFVVLSADHTNASSTKRLRLEQVPAANLDADDPADSQVCTYLAYILYIHIHLSLLDKTVVENFSFVLILLLYAAQGCGVASLVTDTAVLLMQRPL